MGQAESLQSADPLAQARTLFAEAVRDEGAGQFAVALDKFRRVSAVKDTPAVEYRMGTCHEGLGALRAAYTAYERSIRIGQDDPRATAIVAAARERVLALADHVARLRLALPADAPAGLEVRVDGAILPAGDRAMPVALEPGLHSVTVTAPDRPPWQSEVALVAGTEVSLMPALGLTPPEGSAPPAGSTPPPIGEPRPPSAVRKTGAWIAFGAGGALLVGSAVSLALRSLDIAKLHRNCPGGSCPAGADRGDLTSTRGRALAEGPVALALGGGAAIGFAVGAYLLWTSRSSGPSSHPERAALVWLPFIAERSAGLALAGSL